MRPKVTGRFGVEIELNSTDGRNFVENPLKRGEMPHGIFDLAGLVRTAGVDCDVHEWRYDHNPSSWSCKPDSSCGIELCSPVMSLEDCSELERVMGVLHSSPFTSDERCSFHVHLELSDMRHDPESASILAWWVKCEHVFIDFARPNRKNNRYCRPIGVTEILGPDDMVVPEVLFKKLSFKYLSANTFHIFNLRRPTIEFRLAEGTKDYRFAINWIRLLLLFSGRSVSSGLPEDYRWVSPSEVLDFLGADIELERWFLGRAASGCVEECSEMFCLRNRSHALNFYESRLSKY